MSAAFGAAMRRRRRIQRAVAVVAMVGAVVGVAACRGRAASTDDAGTEAAPVVKDDAAGLLFTWVDPKGEPHVEEHVKDVPADARETVRVADPAHAFEASGDRIYVADLRAARPDGTYAVRAISRGDFDALILERRKAHGPTLADPAPAPPGSAAAGAADVPGATRPAVIIYGASWCGACHQAADYLKKRGIAFVEKDIEADPGAQREMQAKLARAGLHGGSIPVLDVRGKVMVGFNPRSVDDALGTSML